MTKLEELLNRIHDGNQEIVEIDYLGQFLVNGPYTLSMPPEGLKEQWAISMVPIEYFPLYGLKCDDPEMAGGLFSEAPFARFDRTNLQNEWLNLPPEPEPLFDLCTDNCGTQFWIGESGKVYGHNINNQIQPIGPISSFVDFAIAMTLEEKNWHQFLQDEKIMTKFDLSPISMMD